MATDIPNLFDLSGQVAVVTGGQKWLGFDMASILAEAGANVIVTSRKLEAAQTAAKKLADTYGVETLGLSLDQCDYESVSAMANDAYAWKKRLDILVNNAGGGVGASAGHLFDREPEDILSMIQTNLIGVIYCCKAVGKYMAENRRGKIINIASIAGLIGRDRRMYNRSEMNGQPVDYAAAKAGVIGFTRDLAGLLSPEGINVNSISPGGFLKPGDLPDTFVSDLADGTMNGRWGKMGSDIKGVTLYLASSASDHMTAQNLVVDGGFSFWK